MKVISIFVTGPCSRHSILYMCGTTQEELNANDKIENIGPLINSTSLEDVDLFAFTDNNPLGSPFRDTKYNKNKKTKNTCCVRI